MHVKNLLLTFVFSALLINACKDKNDPNPSVDCNSKNITVTLTFDSASKCSDNGKVHVTAAGSTGFTYQIDGGAFQSGTDFLNLAAGSHTVTAKDKDGCTKSASIDVLSSTAYGPKFSIVNNIIATKCNQVCHISGAGGATKDIFSTDCKIVTRKLDIKAKAVDDVMGGLNNTEKTQITDWINAGGLTTD